MFFFFQDEDGIRGYDVTGVQTCALPIFGGKGGGRSDMAQGGGTDPSGLDAALASVADLI